VARGEIRWLETVERRGGYEHHKNTDARRPWRWEYRAAYSYSPALGFQ